VEHISCVAACSGPEEIATGLNHNAVCCSVLQCGEVCCNMLRARRECNEPLSDATVLLILIRMTSYIFSYI